MLCDFGKIDIMFLVGGSKYKVIFNIFIFNMLGILLGFKIFVKFFLIF